MVSMRTRALHRASIAGDLDALHEILQSIIIRLHGTGSCCARGRKPTRLCCCEKVFVKIHLYFPPSLSPCTGRLIA